MSNVKPSLINHYNTVMSDPETSRLYKQLERFYPVLYKVDNNFAYSFDTKNKYKMFENSKHMNFVPTYDSWCLYCDDRTKPKKKCSGCKSVFFCNTDCQRKAWKIHKKHCGRDLFSNCSFCGKDIDDSHRAHSWHKCEKCPVKFCSEYCRSKIYSGHVEFDCEYFAKTFNSLDNN